MLNDDVMIDPAQDGQAAGTAEEGKPEAGAGEEGTQAA